MVRNCCGGNTTMPSIFSRTLATVNTDGSWWENAASATWKADALVINLGTNDGSAAIDPEYTYVKTYAEVVMNASKHYGPGLDVFLACGPMSTTYCAPVARIISMVKAEGVKAHFLDQVSAPLICKALPISNCSP